MTSTAIQAALSEAVELVKDGSYRSGFLKGFRLAYQDAVQALLAEAQFFLEEAAREDRADCIGEARAYQRKAEGFQDAVNFLMQRIEGKALEPVIRSLMEQRR